jgi:alkylation response protein AidB-like acyl-CoA dehydrogenase
MTTVEETAELGRTLRRFLEQRGSEAAVRALMEDPRGYDPAVWQQMADQLGLLGLTVPEEYGGLGYGMPEIFPVFEEMGRSLLPSPYLSTVGLAVPALLASGDPDVMAAYLPGIAAGTIIATVAICEGDGGWVEEGVAARAAHDETGWRVTGEKTYVTDAQSCDLILVLARTDQGPALMAVEAAAEGLAIEPQPALDLTRRLATVRLADTPARLVAAVGDGWSIVHQALRVAAVALAAEQVGGAQRVLEMGVAYANTRVAFGRKIGSFQAVKHKLADVLVLVENARSAALDAVRAASGSDSDADLAASVAKAYCSEAYLRAAAENIQVHGGIGFTWEHPAHLYFKRAKSSQILFGSPGHHRDLIGRALGV